MKSHTTRRFRTALGRLPGDIRRQARQAYQRFARDPFHPSLRLKQVHPTRPICSARVSLAYRAVGTRDGDEIAWFWIGPHDEDERLIASL